MESKLKEIEDNIKQYESKIDVLIDINYVLKIKLLADDIRQYELGVCWEYFESDIKSFDLDKKLEENNIKLSSDIFDKKESPKNIILMIKNVVNTHKKIIEGEDRKELDDFNVELSKLYIKHEDYQDEIEDKTTYLYELIDTTFSWLDDNEEFIKITDLLDKICNEICDYMTKHIGHKRTFYEEYFNQKFQEASNNLPGVKIELYVSNFIKHYLFINFNAIFNQICLDVLESNGITDETHIKNIITLYYDYIKQNTKLMMSLYDIDKRMKIQDEN